MEVIEQQGQSLTYLSVHPDGYQKETSYPLIILLHGFGANMYDLAGLAPSIYRRGYVYVCPNAPIEFQIGPGMVGYGWTTPGGSGADPDEARTSEALLETFLDEVIEQYGVSPGRSILLGFSQGGSMTYRCGLVRPERYAGLVALSSGFFNLEELQSRVPDSRAQTIFIAHGVQDSTASLERARQIKSFLETEGYSVSYNEYPMGHEISPDLLADLIPWVHEVLPPIG